jgi:guanine deaminase
LKHQVVADGVKDNVQTSPEEWMKAAIKLAVQNVQSGRGGPFGAVIVKGGSIIATGVNSVTGSNDPTAHAEVSAIRAACETLGTFQLDACELYASCEPCPMCFGAIYWARLAGFYYACTRTDAAEAGFDDAFIYDQMGLRPEERAIKGNCVHVESRLAPFVEWAQSTQKIDY